MTIKKKLFLLVSLLLVAVALVGIVGLVAVKMVSGKIYYLTRETSPLQVKMVKLQQGFEKLAANFTQMALTTSASELSQLRKETEVSLSEIKSTIGDLTKLNAGIDEKVVEDMEKAYSQLGSMGDQRLVCANKLAVANQQLRSGISVVVGETRKLDSAMQGLQKESYATVEKSKEAALRANTQIKRMLSIQEKLGNARGLVMQTNLVSNRFRLNPLKDRMKAEMDAVHSADLGQGALATQIKESAEEIQKGFSGDDGLLAARAGMLADPTSEELSKAFEGKGQELSKQIETLGSKLAGEIDNLELIIPRENGRMSDSINMVSAVGRISGASANVAVLARTIESASRQIMLASTVAELNEVRAKLEGQFGAVAAEIGAIRKGLGALKGQGAAVGNVESAFAGMRGVLLTKDGAVDQVSKNLSTQVSSAQIFGEAKKLIKQLGETGQQKTRSAETSQERAVKEVEKVAAMTTTALALAGLISIGFGIVIGGWISRSINSYMERVISGLNASSEQVANAAGDVSGASQQMAEGASEQAAALEQTSSSLEEVASMSKRNSENAGNANALMGESRKIVEKASVSMAQMTVSMGEISSAGQEIGKIVKTIDDISFQTNLLALNAAVEAARAGEAGKGFAVVAEEVRKLAQRSAEGAKHTSDRVEDVIKKIDGGSSLVRGAVGDFKEVATSADKVAQLVAEIATASNEQSQAMDQISLSLGQMDKVVQKNAANSEEAASAAEELNAQAHRMRGYVEELASLIGGAKGREEGEGEDDDDEDESSPSKMAFLKRLPGIIRRKRSEEDYEFESDEDSK
ncbi:MAG: methyl-accepting chemotaxis protein [Pseudomonadota bacterium]